MPSSLDGVLGSRRCQLLGVSVTSFGAEGQVKWIQALAHAFTTWPSATESWLLRVGSETATPFGNEPRFRTALPLGSTRDDRL